MKRELLGTFEQAVMLALVRLGDGAYGRAILGEVGGRLDREVSAGAVYATLDRLEAKGYIQSHLESGDAARDGRARRYYTPAAPGIQALNDSHATMQTLWRSVRWPLKGGA